MSKTIYDSHKTVSASGRLGWTMVPLLADGTIDSTKATIYTAGATSQAECLAMIGGAGKTTFKQESTNERGTMVSYRYGSVVALDVDTAQGTAGTRAERAAAAFAELAKGASAKDKIASKIK